jgi:hypothetical protein
VDAGARMAERYARPAPVLTTLTFLTSPEFRS